MSGTVEERLDRLEDLEEARDRSGRRLILRAAVVVLLCAALGAFGSWRSERALNASTDAVDAVSRAVDRVERESIDRQVGACSSTNEFRRLFRDYLADQGRGVDPSTALALPGFEDLPEATKGYVRSLVDLVNAGALDAQRAREQYVARFPLIDCGSLRDRLEDQANP